MTHHNEHNTPQRESDAHNRQESDQSQSSQSKTETTGATTAVRKRLSAKATTWIAAGVAIVVVAALALVATLTYNASGESDTTEIDTIYTKQYQAQADAKVQAEKTAETYTADNMLVLENPYGTNTTSLYVYFNTDNPTSVSYTVSAPDTDYPDFSATAYQDDEFQTSHEFTVLGLIPETNNTITFTIATKTGKQITKTLNYTMGPLLGSEEVQVADTKSNDATKLSDGLYAILGNDSDDQDFMYYYDNYGVIRGEIPIRFYRSHRLLFKDDIMYFSVSTRDIIGMDRLGHIVKWYNTGDKYILHHDYAMDSDGNLVVLATDTDTDTIQDNIIKIDTETGAITKLVDMGDLYASYKESAEFASMGVSATTTDDTSKNFDADATPAKKDWIHLNTIQLLDDGSAILSSRETSTIIKLDAIESNPSIDYMIGEKSFWKDSDDAKYLLTKDTSDGDWSSTGGQHTVTYESDSSLPAGQYYLYMFDNNYGSSNTRPDYDWAAHIDAISTKYTSGDHSNYYKYLVDETAGTYKLVSSFEVPYSPVVSSAQELSDDTILIDSGTKGMWGVYDTDGTLIEQYQMKVDAGYIYRVYKYDFKGFYFAA